MGMLRWAELFLLVVVTAGLLGPCWITSFFPAAGEIYVSEPGAFPGYPLLTALCLVQGGLLLLNRRLGDLMACFMGLAGAYLMTHNGILADVFTPAGGLMGTWDHEVTVFGYAVIALSWSSLLLCLGLLYRNMRNWQCGGRKLRAAVVILAFVIMAAAAGPCVREEAVPMRDDMLGWVEFTPIPALPLIWLLMTAQLLFLNIGGKIPAAAAGAMAAAAFPVILMAGFLEKISQPIGGLYGTVYSYTALGWLLTALAAANAGLCLYMADQLSGRKAMSKKKGG